MTKNILLWVVIALVALTLFSNFSTKDEAQEISYTAFVAEVENDRVSSVVEENKVLHGTRKDGTQFKVVKSDIPDYRLLEDMLNQGVEFRSVEADTNNFWTNLLLAMLPVIFIVVLFGLMIRNMQGMGGRGGPLQFAKSKARKLTEEEVDTTFADVAGVDEAKEEVQELVEFLRDGSKFQKLGARIPRGTLMVGAPGTGKTLLAKAIAGEAKVAFFSISGSDFVEMFVGVGASRVRDMFAEAKSNAPCIVFIDEIDAVGRHRGAGLGNGHDEREQTLNQLLVEMDGFQPNDGVIVIAATNRPDVLDPALMRPGRFDRQVVVPLPDIRGREQILKVHMRRIKCSDDVKPELIARGTPGFSGADLENVVNEAALFAARRGRVDVTMEEFEQAKDKIMMGAERRSMVMSDKEKRNTAYHESGHAIVGYSLEDHDDLYKITVIPRGRALGVTTFLPEEDRYSLTKAGVEAQICSLFGGRVAEEIINGEDKVTTGASNDIERATELARNMVTKWGFSDRLGPLLYSEKDSEPFLGMSASTQAKSMADETAKAIDQEIRDVIDTNYARAREIIETNMDKLHALAKWLIEFETLNPEQVAEIMEGKDPTPPELPPTRVQPESPEPQPDKGTTGETPDAPPFGTPATDP